MTIRHCLIEESKYHFVSEDGKVFSIDHMDSRNYFHKGKEIKGKRDKDGYKTISISTGERGRRITRRVSRLVAIAFIPNPENKPFVNHIDGDKTNDHVSNLEWVTAKENTQHAWKVGLCKAYDRSLPYNRQGIIDSNKRRAKRGICGV